MAVRHMAIEKGLGRAPARKARNFARLAFIQLDPMRDRIQTKIIAPKRDLAYL